MDIKLDTTAIQDAVVRAVADSAIGEQINKVIVEKFTSKKNSWDSQTIMERAIEGEVNTLIGKIIREEIEQRREEIRALVQPQLTDEIIKAMSAAALEAMLGNLTLN